MSKWIVLWTGLVIACGRGGHGGGLGIEGSRPFVSLTPGEITDLCEYVVALIGPKRDIDCGGGKTRTVGATGVSQCISEFQRTQQGTPTCAATVGGVEDCFGDIADLTDAQWCTDPAPPASCIPLFQCEPGDDQPPPPPGL